MPSLRPSTTSIDSTHLLAHAVTALRQAPGGAQHNQDAQRPKGGPFSCISLPFPLCLLPPSPSSTCDHSRIRHTVVPEISSCTASPPPGTATNRALAATGSEILLAALVLIIPWCTCTLFKPGPDGLPPYHQLISGYDCVCSLCSSILASTTTPRQRSSHSIRVFQVPSLEYADL
jgi:hypothetical protein